MRFFETIHGVYFDDLDAFEILHNARYLLLFERTIGSFWKHIGWGGLLDKDSNPDQYQLVRVNHLEYLRAVRGTDEVRVRVWIQRLGRTSLTFAFKMLPLDEDLNYAEGYRVLVRIDPETRQPVPWTDAFRETIAPYREDLDSP